MALTAEQREYALYAIGTVESNCTWTSVNYNDPITIGIAQWYGTRASGLLSRIQAEVAEAFALLAQTLKDDLAAHAASSSFWDGRYLTRAEGNSFIDCANYDGVNAVQESQFYDDLEGYETTLTGWGCATDTPAHVKSFIYCAGMYHQSPAACGRVLSSVTGTTTLERLRDTALNDRTFSSYRNRYNGLYDLLNEWDGLSAPPDFGQSGTVDDRPGGDDEGVSQLASQIHHVQVYGESLAIFGKDADKGLLCYRAQSNYYIPQRNTVAPDNPSTPSGPSGPITLPIETIDQMQQLWRDHRDAFWYGQGAGRLTPLTSGHSDCSGCIWWAVNEYSPEAAQAMGNSTYDMLRADGVVIASGSYEAIDPSVCRQGDIIVYGWDSTNIMAATTRHVDWIFADDEVWSAGESRLPHPISTVADVVGYYGSVPSWRVIRVFS